MDPGRDIDRERSHVPVPCFAICFRFRPHRGLPANLELVGRRHECGKPFNITPVDRVDEPDDGRDWRKRSSHPLILTDDGSGRANPPARCAPEGGPVAGGAAGLTRARATWRTAGPGSSWIICGDSRRGACLVVQAGQPQHPACVTSTTLLVIPSPDPRGVRTPLAAGQAWARIRVTASANPRLIEGPYVSRVSARHRKPSRSPARTSIPIRHRKRSPIGSALRHKPAWAAATVAGVA